MSFSDGMPAICVAEPETNHACRVPQRGLLPMRHLRALPYPILRCVSRSYAPQQPLLRPTHQHFFVRDRVIAGYSPYYTENMQVTTMKMPKSALVSTVRGLLSSVVLVWPRTVMADVSRGWLPI